MPSFKFARTPRGVALGFLLIGSIFVVFWVWDSLSWHARGMILAAYGVTALAVGLIPALRTRGLLKSGAPAQGMVVDVEEETSQDHDDHTTSTTYYPVVQFTTADGRTMKFTSAVGYGSEPPLGDAVPVRYRPNDPEQAEIDRAITWMLPAAFGLLGGLGLLVAAVVVYTEEPQIVPAAVNNLDDTMTEEPVPELRPPPPEVVTGRIGDRLTVRGQSGSAQLEIAVVQLRFSTGDQIDQPEHGLYMGAYVKAHALSDEQDALDIYALVDGHHHDADAIISSTTFEPSLDIRPFNEGERAAGWLVFDVPARHGQLVLRDLDEHKVAVWTY